ncbi:cyclic beta 1-2 glucan synthetase [Ramlibacter sp. USB13]|uniref:Cyclic beta 1-2 glucan synthetase n=1 Tax=Ramlibacter cellulosilyticus TaxID=2764187 RepID=A0A923MWB4_9BURK|nr:glucoamylase family protein [Ramlibacter cellulosilyticus]MBC5785329.1 cyclic beta 1-2 glucan synthetase [Ramlibacter cellulosilyticus]
MRARAAPGAVTAWLRSRLRPLVDLATPWVVADAAPNDRPLRAELLSADQMERHGQALARTHVWELTRAADRLLPRLADNRRTLAAVCAVLLEDEARRCTPAGEWLVDNDYLLQQEMRAAARYLPTGYSRALPRLRSGPGAGLPRVYDLAVRAVAHGDGRLELGTLRAFFAAYQSVSPLLLGELWAIAIMLRLALIENLRRVAVRVAASRAQSQLAAGWADRMFEVAGREPKGLILVVADMARSEPPMTPAFVAELVRRLHGHSAALALPLSWLEQRLAETHQSADQLVQAEAQSQAAEQVSVSNSIGSLRLLAATDWPAFVENLSVVERTLRADPAGVYAHMDFATRDTYRHAVERIARASAATEEAVAQAVVAMAGAAARPDTSDDDLRRAHVGYYLVGPGRPAAEARVGARAGLATTLRRGFARHPLAWYAGSIAAASLLLPALLLLRTVPLGGAGSWPTVAPAWWIVAGLALPLAASQLAVALVNWLAMLLARPRPLARMDFSAGIPARARTLVVVPTMLDGAAAIAALVEALEVRFLANRDDELRFALLTDFHDAPSQHCEGDDALVRAACAGIAALNDRYPLAAGGGRFFLLHRARAWNGRDAVWMGYERKRGKLAALNGLLRDGDARRFAATTGDLALLAGVRYVITLDTDTQLPRDAAWKFVATMAHPLNRPRFGGAPQACRVVEGYGILQPRVAVSHAAAHRSRYALLHGGEPGIDPYTRAVSDVYQDVFGEGSFIGKGIYEVDAFERVLGGRLPEDQVLSHDLLEGCYARSGLLSDVQLVEDSPARYDDDVRRRHRWMRGDWQIAGWLLPRLRLRTADARDPAATQVRRVPNPLSALSRWKILDNLRRSLVPVALTVSLVLGWTVLQPAWLWTLAALGVLFLPGFLALAADAVRKPVETPLRQHLAALVPAARSGLAQAVLALACLPHEAWVSLDAIVRTTWRLRWSGRRLLEWEPSRQGASAPAGTAASELARSFRRMAFAPVCAVAVAGALAAWRADALAAALPVLVLWLGAPGLAWWVSRPLVRRRSTLDAEQAAELRRLARRTWAFFETFVTADEHFLPPDNMQEVPEPRVAHRTSPTNMGLSLLASLAARDFGYLTEMQLIERTGATLATMERLERHHGHFLNWYDTRSLQPLRPAYVSSVDSGNLAGHLLTLRAGLLLLADEAPQVERLLHGLADTLALVRQGGGAIATPVSRFSRLLALGLPPGGELQAMDDLHRCAVDIRAATALSAGRAPGDADRWSLALADQCAAARDEIRRLLPAQASAGRSWHAGALQARRAALRALAERAGALGAMDPAFLYDPVCRQLAIGYNVDDRRRDAGFYDLLASEARLAIFVAVAQAQLPQESWFALGRQAASLEGRTVLLSWSGSMFEYLMPLLVMPSYGNTLLDETMHGAVAAQVRYGRLRGVPWGISESGYNLTDSHLNYQYRAFGVPGLGLKRGLADDVVVAPYATVLALMVDPAAATPNLRRLAAEGAAGTFGFYEAVDYTAARLRRGESRAVVRSYMAHHQGMSLLAVAHALLDRPMQRRFASDPRVRATLLLLQERVPRAVAPRDAAAPPADDRGAGAQAQTPLRIVSDPDTPAPEVQLLSNGRYHLMLSHAGGGYSRWKDLALTRWHEDRTTDAWGSFCYLRDLDTGTFWSAAHQPARWKADHSETIFTEGRAEFRRVDQGIDAYTEIVVSPEDDIELRRLRLTNRGRARRVIEVTSYTEPVLSPAAADAQHPAFSKLFLQTEILADPAALLCTRRPRAAGDASPSMFHLVAVHGAQAGSASHESDRARFIGRGRSLRYPAALRDAAPLSGSSGAVLDPVLATRRVVTLEPEQTAVVDLVWGVADSREGCIALARKYMDRRIADRVFELAWTHSQVSLRQLNASEADAQLYARLASGVVYSDAHLRAPPAVLLRNRRAQSGLWGYAISGDLPIVLLQIGDASSMELVRQLVQAHAWWRLKGLAVDLVIWNEERDVYRQRLQEEILGLIAGSIESHEVDRPGGIFVRHAEQIAVEDRVLLQSVARVILADRLGSLAEQVGRLRVPRTKVAPLAATRGAAPAAAKAGAPREPLLFDNGLGGFTPDGREYAVAPAAGERPPAPWVNVIANPRFGTVLSDAGSSYTWCENAHELRLTPWHNDGVTDDCGEVLYLRDEESGRLWNPTSLPLAGEAAAPSAYVARHGFGYSVFEHDEGGVHSELTVFVATDAAVKFSRLVLRNDGDRTRQLSATAYVEWVLGDMRARTAPHIHTEVAADSGAVLARNRYSNQFGDWLGFLDVDEADRLAGTMTCDRTEFIGRNGSLRGPAALRRAHLSGRSGAALDPCAAIQVPLRLAPGESREVTFRLGMGRSLDEVQQLVARFRGSFAVQQALADVHAHWKHLLGAVQVRTPDPALDVLANGWLVYQTLGCRIMARSGYYQSGGAFGFRDQLQDAMALVHARPLVLREQLLACAGRQFAEGDVQHWWHPPAGHGVRTRISDDYLWLPLALCRYVEATNDTGVLAEPVHFLEGRALGPQEESYYDLPVRSGRAASVYAHAALALEHGLRFGAHGLPLMGAGDWNDGMNRVGHAGRGESVWLGFFLCEVLRQFAPLARRQGDDALARRCEAERAGLSERLEASAWDGEWYLRAWFDDGTPLGASAGTECRIDAVAQSWSALSGVAARGRAVQAMRSVSARLVRPQARLVQLLDPPFDGKGPDPGYIAGYLPGVRENGGQYTHAAVWTAMAFAALGDARRAWQVMDMINPLNHGRTPADIATYRVEPYVVAADVYGVPPHTGRGGWSWYTGSAGWMYRLVVESLLGLRLRITDDGASLEITPCLPEHWSGYAVDYRFRTATYRIEVGAGPAPPGIEVDGQPQGGGRLALVDDGKAHVVRVKVAGRQPA